MLCERPGTEKKKKKGDVWTGCCWAESRARRHHGQTNMVAQEKNGLEKAVKGRAKFHESIGLFVAEYRPVCSSDDGLAGMPHNAHKYKAY